MNKIYIIILAAVATLTMASCEKVSPIGVLVSGTGVEDRIKMSNLYYQQHKADFNILVADKGEYTFLVGADSHITDDMGRMEEMLQIGLDKEDFEIAKKSVYGDVISSLNNVGSIANTIEAYHFNGNELFSYIDAVAETTFDDITARLAEMLDVNNCTLSVIKPEGAEV